MKSKNLCALTILALSLPSCATFQSKESASQLTEKIQSTQYKAHNLQNSSQKLKDSTKKSTPFYIKVYDIFY
jgi:hypothetical protein